MTTPNPTPSTPAATSPAITVVMPVFNRKKYLAEAIESVLAQTCDDFQLFVVDDGSKDRSLAIALDFAARDRRVRVFQRDHEGCYAARNFALGRTQSPFTAIIDSDDIAHPDRLKLQLAFLQSHPEHVAVGSWVTFTDPFGVAHRTLANPDEHEAIDAQHIAGRPAGLVHGAALCRTAALRQIGGYHLAPCAADYDLFLRLAEIGKLANIPQSLQSVRLHRHSISMTRSRRQLDLARQFVDEARTRRGLTPLDHVNEANMNPPAKVLTIAEQARLFALHAIHAGRLGIARRHTLAVLARRPLNIETWRLVRWSIRG